MRDPLGPIPSPHWPGVRYWDRAAPVAPEPDATPPRWDPTALLGRHEDVLGIDRRSRARADRGSEDPPAPRGSPLTAAAHVSLRGVVLGLRSRHGWALVRGLALSPAGVLVQHFDLLDPTLEPADRRRGTDAFVRLAHRLPGGRRTRARTSPLALVGGCVLSARVVADLARWTSRPRPPRTDLPRRSSAPVGVTLLVPDPDAPPLPIPGELAPLTDPHPGVLAVALDPAAHDRLAVALGLAPGDRPTPERATRAPGAS